MAARRGFGPGVLRPLEEAFGLPLAGAGEPLPRRRGETDPRRALDEILIGALSRPPCLVAFSGGRDSSALLAAAAEAARRERLPLPVPVTARFPRVATADEAGWQEQLVTHLSLPDWPRVEITDELDLVGPYARRLLAAHGNHFPFNAHFSAPLVEQARGGTLITGVGGDEVFGMTQWSRAARLLNPTGPWSHRLAGRIVDGAPGPLRYWAIRGQLDSARPWMTPRAGGRARRHWTYWMAQHPVSRERAVREWLWPSRYWQLARASLALVGQLWGAELVNPFMEPGFLQAAATRLGPSGHPPRAAAIEALLGPGLLPDNVRHRRSKATFDQVFFAAHSRKFVDRWDQTGLDPELVDPRRLHQEWRRHPRPDARSYSLVKAAWLASRSPSGPAR